VTAPPASGDQRSAVWLIRDHALTVLPAVSSLKTLRRVARPGAASKPMIGFGNPLLDGDQKHPKFGAYYKELAQRARDKQHCPETAWQRVAALVGLRRGVTPVQTHGGLADVDFLRKQAPLPETADELCAVARDVQADSAAIYLGARATEREVKLLGENGQLAQYRIVHFATHGALAGQVAGNSEPGLLLTSPAEPSETDDGYLTASEIAGLKLDADWVILSACNTAAGGAQGAEALSGLARAFIYAQARALLVSHWEVNSAATVQLITGGMSRLAANKSIGRAEALRLSMLALIDKGEPLEAHPAFWAPFVVVGEGGAGR
jgi:CHAT domain-containing protein